MSTWKSKSLSKKMSSCFCRITRMMRAFTLSRKAAKAVSTSLWKFHLASNRIQGKLVSSKVICALSTTWKTYTQSWALCITKLQTKLKYNPSNCWKSITLLGMMTLKCAFASLKAQLKAMALIGYNYSTVYWTCWCTSRRHAMHITESILIAMKFKFRNQTLRRECFKRLQEVP